MRVPAADIRQRIDGVEPEGAALGAHYDSANYKYHTLFLASRPK